MPGEIIGKDALEIEFPEIIPTPKDDTTFAFIAKYVAGSRGFGAVWARLIGEVGTNKRSGVSGLEADENGVYITGAFTSGAITNLSYQTCEFGARVPECEPGGSHYIQSTTLCGLQKTYRQAPNQVCARYNNSLLERHVVRTQDFRRYTGTLRQGMFLASYNHKGVLRWHREAIGGNITVAAMALSAPKDIIFERDKGKPRRNTRLSRRGRFVYVTGNVLEYFGPMGNVIEHTNFGQMKFPLTCSQNKTLVQEDGNSTPTASVVGSYTEGPANTACSGRITSLGSGSDIYLAQFSADDGEPQWLKRFGQRDAWDFVADIDLNRRYSTIFMTGSFAAKTPGIQDVFSMAAAGRLHLISCPLWGGPEWNPNTARLEYQYLTNESMPSCTLSPFFASDPPGALTGFVMEISEGNAESPGEKPWEYWARVNAETAAREQARRIEEEGPSGEEEEIIVPWVGILVFFAVHLYGMATPCGLHKRPELCCKHSPFDGRALLTNRLGILGSFAHICLPDRLSDAGGHFSDFDVVLTVLVCHPFPL